MLLNLSESYFHVIKILNNQLLNCRLGMYYFTIPEFSSSCIYESNKSIGAQLIAPTQNILDLKLKPVSALVSTLFHRFRYINCCEDKSYCKKQPFQRNIIMEISLPCQLGISSEVYVIRRLCKLSNEVKGKNKLIIYINMLRTFINIIKKLHL